METLRMGMLGSDMLLLLCWMMSMWLLVPSALVLGAPCKREVVQGWESPQSSQHEPGQIWPIPPALACRAHKTRTLQAPGSKKKSCKALAWAACVGLP